MLAKPKTLSLRFCVFLLNFYDTVGTSRCDVTARTAGGMVRMSSEDRKVRKGKRKLSSSSLAAPKSDEGGSHALTVSPPHPLTFPAFSIRCSAFVVGCSTFDVWSQRHLPSSISNLQFSLRDLSPHPCSNFFSFFTNSPKNAHFRKMQGTIKNACFARRTTNW